MHFPHHTVLVNMPFLSFLCHFTPLPDLSLSSFNIIKMSTDSSAPNCSCLKSSGPLVCASYAVWRDGAWGYRYPHITCSSFSQSMKFPWLNPFLWFKAFSLQDVFMSDSHLIQCGLRVQEYQISLWRKERYDVTRGKILCPAGSIHPREWATGELAMDGP